MQHYSAISLRNFGGHTPNIGQRVLIDPSAVVLGQVTLEDDVSVWPQVAIRGDMHRIRVGARTRARIPRPLPRSKLSINGTQKAAVLPVPVRASPRTSRPSSAGGIALA